jgi:hypothetical protein
MRQLNKHLVFLSAGCAIVALIVWFLWTLAVAAAEIHESRRATFEAGCAERAGYITESDTGKLSCVRQPLQQRNDQQQE